MSRSLMTYTPEQISSIVPNEIETPELTIEQKNKLKENLKVLATHDDWYVRNLVAQIPGIPPETLIQLESDEDSKVRNSAKKNLEENYKTHNLKLTTNQYNALKALITASQDETLRGLMDS